MTTPTHYAAIDDSGSGTVYGLGATEEAAVSDALRGCRDLTGLVAVPCTDAAARHIKDRGGAPSPHLSVSLRSGVCLREEEQVARAARKAATPKSPSRSGAVLVLLTPEEREEVRAAAKRDERPMTAWLRRVALAAARSP